MIDDFFGFYFCVFLILLFFSSLTVISTRVVVAIFKSIKENLAKLYEAELIIGQDVYNSRQQILCIFLSGKAPDRYR